MFYRRYFLSREKNKYFTQVFSNASTLAWRAHMWAEHWEHAGWNSPIKCISEQNPVCMQNIAAVITEISYCMCDDMSR
jgi:hypothetical protein